MSTRNGYYANFSNVGGPKGNLGDYKHAARLYVDNNMRLAPKFKHLYHVVFNINPTAKASSPLLRGIDQKEVNILAKNAELPKYNLQTASLNQYNRKKIVQTGVEYMPISIEFHDDNAGLTTLFWEAYFRYYYNDSSYTERDGAEFPKQTVDAYQKTNGGLNRTYANSDSQKFRYGLDRPNKVQNFFNSIQIYQMHPQDQKSTFTSFTLINPYIESLMHDQMDQTVSDFVTTRMSINYESVQYNRGYTTEGSAPQGFAETHYDKQPSPLSLAAPNTLLGSKDSILGAANSYTELQRNNNNTGVTDAQNKFYRNIKPQPFQGSNIDSNVAAQSALLGNRVFPKPASSRNETPALPWRPN
jgi:hypothetical protein